MCLDLNEQEQGTKKEMWKLLTPSLELKCGPEKVCY